MRSDDEIKANAWLRDQHARYHDEPGNMLGRDDCGWERCEFWDAAAFVAADRTELLARAQQAEVETVELAARLSHAADARDRLAAELAEARAENERLRDVLRGAQEEVEASWQERDHARVQMQAVEALCERAISPHQETGEAWTITDLAEQIRALAAVSSEPEDEPPLEPGVRPCCGDVHFGDGCPEDGGQQ